MAYLIKHRATGWFVAKIPYKNSDSRYTRERGEAQKFSRYVDAFNKAGTSELVVED